jgi:hypothetical protein
MEATLLGQASACLIHRRTTCTQRIGELSIIETSRDPGKMF